MPPPPPPHHRHHSPSPPPHHHHSPPSPPHHHHKHDHKHDHHHDHLNDNHHHDKHDHHHDPHGRDHHGHDHHRKRYADMWWSEIPEKAQKAAITIGYDEKTWDDDSSVKYDHKTFPETTMEERLAAMYLGMNPIDEKLDIDWADTDPETRKHATVIGWDHHKWDHDWTIRDLPIEHKHWNELTEEEKRSVSYFGYCKCTWDEDNDDSELSFSKDDSTPGKSPLAASSKIETPLSTSGTDEKKEDDYTSHTQAKVDVAVEEVVQGSPASTQTANQATTSASNTTPKIIKSKKFGGDGGASFNHGNHAAIAKLSVRHDGHAVHQISAVYIGGKKMTSGQDVGQEVQLNFNQDEYVEQVTIRHNRLVQCLTFKTNKGRMLGPAGGKGWGKIFIKRDKEGEEEVINAPRGYKLCGFSGSAGDYLDAIVLHWDPIK